MRRNTDMDRIYDTIDVMMKAGDFGTLDELLLMSRRMLPILSTDQMLALLTATLPAKTQLPHRRVFFHSVWDALVRRQELEPGLLDGLE